MKIVVRGANWIGDAVMTIPALMHLRQAFPGARISLFTRPWAQGVFQDAEFIDDIIAIEPSSSRLSSILQQSRQLSQVKFDLSILFPNSFESALIARLAGIPRRVGYATERRGFMLTDPFPVPAWKNERHESNYYLDLVTSMIGQAAAEVGLPALTVSAKRREMAREMFRTFGFDRSKYIVGFGAGSTNSLAKRWPAENFAALATKLTGDLEAAVLLLGAENESEVSSRVCALTEGTPIDLTGKTELGSATAILSELDLFISNDMGLAHIAAAVGTPTIAIFGPTNESATRPLGRAVQIIREPVECAPCMLRECPIDHRCMTRISPDRVFESALKMLETQSR